MRAGGEREAVGVVFGEAVFAEAADLLKDGIEVGVVALLRPTCSWTIGMPRVRPSVASRGAAQGFAAPGGGFVAALEVRMQHVGLDRAGLHDHYLNDRIAGSPHCG